MLGETGGAAYEASREYVPPLPRRLRAECPGAARHRASAEDADRIEGVLHAIWPHNERIERARVHREGNVLVVAWNDSVSPECWTGVNAGVVDRLRRGRR